VEAVTSRQRIRSALEAKGYVVESLAYDPTRFGYISTSDEYGTAPIGWTWETTPPLVPRCLSVPNVDCALAEIAEASEVTA
jgi:hypothetical protein